MEQSIDGIKNFILEISVQKALKAIFKCHVATMELLPNLFEWMICWVKYIIDMRSPLKPKGESPYRQIIRLQGNCRQGWTGSIDKMPDGEQAIIARKCCSVFNKPLTRWLVHWIT